MAWQANRSCTSYDEPLFSIGNVMQRLLAILKSIISTFGPDRSEERYLALSTDAHDLEVRLQAMQRVRP